MGTSIKLNKFDFVCFTKLLICVGTLRCMHTVRVRREISREWRRALLASPLTTDLTLRGERLSIVFDTFANSPYYWHNMWYIKGYWNEYVSTYYFKNIVYRKSFWQNMFYTYLTFSLQTEHRVKVRPRNFSNFSLTLQQYLY